VVPAPRGVAGDGDTETVEYLLAVGPRHELLLEMCGCPHSLGWFMMRS
jgi:hypothetical protein